MPFKSPGNALCLIASAVITLLPTTGFTTKPITTTMLLESLKPGEPWDMSVLTAAKTVLFSQATTTTGGVNATVISAAQLGFFITTDCSLALAGAGFYTTPASSPTFPISLGAAFGLTAAGAWKVGSTQLGITDMTLIDSIAIMFKSTSSNTPQSNFSGASFACIPVTCFAGPSGTCISGSGTQSFELKTIAAIGDPADGGKLACMNGNPNNLVVPAADNSTGIEWDPDTTDPTTNATSITDGSGNTDKIVAVYGTPRSAYAAGICQRYAATGGYWSGWFLPAGNNTTLAGQLNCLYNNKAAIGGFFEENYWSSTEVSASNAWRQSFGTGVQASRNKISNQYRVRCARALTP